MTNRRDMLKFIAGLLNARYAGEAATPTTTSAMLFGAIRWDAQYCDLRGQPCFEEEKALGDHKWQYRAPLHTKVISQDQVIFSASQDTFDAELAIASQLGLKFWAYLAYGENGCLDLNHSMMKGLSFHLSSLKRDDVKMSIIATLDTFGFAGNFLEAQRRVMSLLVRPFYLTTDEGRPVLFLYYLDSLLEHYWAGSLKHLKEAVDSLRECAIHSGLKDPYIIVMHVPPEGAEKVRASIGADAISAYAITCPVRGKVTYATLVTFVSRYWGNELLATRQDVVPTVMIGWDTRPRKEHPPAYDKSTPAQLDTQAHVVAPTSDEFREACRLGRDFVLSHPRQSGARIVIIYAWNENSEGGALEPTIGDPKASLLTSAGSVFSQTK